MEQSGMETGKVYERPKLRKHGGIRQVTFSSHCGQSMDEQNRDLINFAEGEAMSPKTKNNPTDQAIKALNSVLAGGTTRNVPYGQTADQVNRDVVNPRKFKIQKAPKNAPSPN